MTVLSRLSGLPHYLNPILTPLARWLPPLAVVHHNGRTSGNSYTTPVQAFRTPTGFIVGLAYTPDANWALNLLADGTGELTRCGRRYTISKPHRRGPEAREDLIAPVRWMMQALRIDHFIAFDATQIRASNLDGQ